MDIGVPRELKDNENRVGITPEGVERLVGEGHNIKVEEEAGEGSGISDQDYLDAGAEIVDQEDAWDSEMVMKVKEPLEQEYNFLEDQIVFTYFHLAAEKDLTEKLLETDVKAIAYETVEEDGRLPLLEPMSQVAGRMAPLIGSYYQTKHNKGRGKLPAGLPGVEPAEVAVLGGGTVGKNAAKVAAGIGCDVTVIELNQQRMAKLEDILPQNVNTKLSNRANIRSVLKDSDIVVGAVLLPGAAAPKLIKEEDVKEMKEGSVLVDVAVDQGGISETTRPTSHSEPTYVEHGVVHYAVTNMPGAFANTATYGLTNATLPYAVELANKGWKKACDDNSALRKGLNVVNGKLVEKHVADAFDLEHMKFRDLQL